MRKSKFQITIGICKEANRDHKRSKRQYAHTFHHKNCICVADSMMWLPSKIFWAIMAHELGHIIAGYEGSEQDANRAANRFFSIKIKYRDCKHGKHLEHLTDDEAERVRQMSFEAINFTSRK